MVLGLGNRVCSWVWECVLKTGFFTSRSSCSSCVRVLGRPCQLTPLSHSLVWLLCLQQDLGDPPLDGVHQRAVPV